MNLATKDKRLPDSSARNPYLEAAYGPEAAAIDALENAVAGGNAVSIAYAFAQVLGIGRSNGAAE